MKNDSNSYHAVDGFHCSAAIVSALILCFLFFASPAHANYIYDNKTGSWLPTSSTVLAPAGASSPFNHVPRETPPTVSSTGAFQKKTGGTFGSPPVNGTSQKVPVTVTGTTTKANVNKALLSRLTKGGIAGIAIGLGVETLLSGIGALISEGGTVSKASNAASQSENPPSSYDFQTSAPSAGWYRPDLHQSQIDAYLSRADILTIETKVNGPSKLYIYCLNVHQNRVLVGWSAQNNKCYYSYGATPVPRQLVPFPPADLQDAIDSGAYQPHPSDYPFLSSDPAMIPTVVTVDPIPRATFPPVTTTTVDLDTGKTTTVQTNIWHDFNIKDNNTSQPKIDTDITTQTDTYVDGSKTQSSTTTTSTGVGSEPAASAGGSSPPPPEMPIDCDLFPTACAWMEWTQEEPTEPEDNLSDLLKEVPISKETFTISGGAAACPAPIVLNLSQFGSREVSYQPLCDLASTMKFLYLALMSFAAAVLLHRSISRV